MGYLLSLSDFPGKHSIAQRVVAYVGANAAAMFTAIELGLQPLIAQKPDGTPLYAPYPLSITIPAMMIGHLVAGLAEAAVTAAGIAYVTQICTGVNVHNKLFKEN